MLLGRVLVILASMAFAAASATPTIRDTNNVACDFLVEANTMLSPVTNYDQEFTTVIQKSLASDVGSESDVTQSGTNHSVGIFGHFAVHTSVAAKGKTAEQTASIIQGWDGQVKKGVSADWLIKSVSCA